LKGNYAELWIYIPDIIYDSWNGPSSVMCMNVDWMQ